MNYSYESVLFIAASNLSFIEHIIVDNNQIVLKFSMCMQTLLQYFPTQKLFAQIKAL